MTVAVIMAALLGMAALAVDASYLMEIRSQMQSTADAAALAATSGLVTSPAEAELRAVEYARHNPVLGHTVRITPSEITYGQWSFDTDQFTPTNASPNSMRIEISLSGTPELANPQLFFAPILGFNTTDVGARATASLGNRNVVLTLDRSNSMDDDSLIPPQPWTDTKAASVSFLSMIQQFPIEGDLVGFVHFSDRGVLENRNRLTENFSAIQTSIENLPMCNQTVPPACGGFTNIAEGMQRARQEVTNPARSNPRGLKVVVLLTDGKPNTTIGGTPGNMCIPCTQPCTCQTRPGNRAEQQVLEQARTMQNNGVVLYAISLGNDTNQQLMRMAAETTGGEHFYAPSTDELNDIFEQISARIPVVLVE